MTTDYIIDIENLKKSYDDTVAVSGINLRVNIGEMFGLVGPDGAGKTSTIRMLCGVLDPDDGDGSILGLNMITEIESIKREIGYLSQKFSLYGDLTVNENIEFFAEIHSISNYRKRRDELLKFTRLTDFGDRLADRLSGGMRQKLALACTLIHQPKLILLDEPTVGVDPVSRRDFWMILSTLLKDGMTIVVTTPYLDEAERCGRVALMHRGEILICDTPQKVKSTMKGEVVEVVCKDTRHAYKTLKADGTISEVQAFGDRLSVIVEISTVATSIVKTALEKNGIEPESIRTVEPSLENVFISMVSSGKEMVT